MSLRVPLFDGEENTFSRIRMKSNLMSIGLEVWTLVEKGYDVPKVTSIEAEDKKKFWEHVNSLNTLQYGLSNNFLAKLLNCGNAKYL